jgi:adenylylsulfate kinase
MILQFTGLSGAGKTSIASRVKALLEEKGVPTEVIDGDHYRKTLCADLGFSRKDRCENIRRLGVVALSFDRPGALAIISAINPYNEVRNELRDNYNAKVIWIRCSMPVLLERDTKGLYKRALLPEGHPQKLRNLTGVNDTYEIPADADLVIDTTGESLETSAQRLFEFVMGQVGKRQ